MLFFYGFFLNKSKPSMAIAMTITIITAAIPSSTVAVDAKPVTGVGVGAAVAEGPCTVMPVCALDP